MKLSKLYSNRPDEFVPIEFLPGINVVLAEIRLPENKHRDTHNLGKTTLGSIVNFCLLSGRDPKFFLFKHAELFRGFVFFLEVELLNQSFVTIRRGVEQPTLINFKLHTRAHCDFSDLPDRSWDHQAVTFDQARQLLDGILDLRDIKPWAYRNIIGYLLRSQDDFRDVFQLKKFAGPHSEWKPFLARVLGFSAPLLVDYYAKEAEIAGKKKEEEIIKGDLGGTVGDVSKTEGMLLLKREEAEKKQARLDAFNFHQADKDETRLVVDSLDADIGRLNAERYSLSANRKKVSSALEDDEILFNATAAAELFAEAGVVFAGQIKRDFEQLLSFNRALTEERRGYLKEELTEINRDLKRINAELSEANRRRSEALAFVKGTDVFSKYKQATDEMVTLRAHIAMLEQQRESLRRLQDLRATIRALTEEKSHLQIEIEKDVERRNSEKTSLFSEIRLYFSQIVEEVIDRKALLSVAPNQLGHIEFKAEILDESGIATSADRGFTYRKLLCMAFDLAVLRAHMDGRFPRFVFHDGVFESLDDRKKQKLMGVLRSYADLGIQHIMTLIDSDMPVLADGAEVMFSEFEVVLRLHDEDETGRLFRMRAW